MPCHGFCWHPDLCHSKLTLAPGPGLSQADISRPMVRWSTASAVMDPHTQHLATTLPWHQKLEAKLMGGWHVKWHDNAKYMTHSLNSAQIRGTWMPECTREWNVQIYTVNIIKFEHTKKGWIHKTTNFESGSAGRFYVSITQVRDWLTLLMSVCTCDRSNMVTQENIQLIHNESNTDVTLEIQ